MLDPGNIIFIDTGLDSPHNPRIYHILGDFFMENGRRWYICDLFYRFPSFDIKNYHVKADTIIKYINYKEDELRSCDCRLISEDELAKFLLKRE